MTFAVFLDPAGTAIPVNLSRVAYVERTRSVNEPKNWSGRLRLYFAKDFYLEIKDDEVSQAIIHEHMIPMTEPK